MFSGLFLAFIQNRQRTHIFATTVRDTNSAAVVTNVRPRLAAAAGADGLDRERSNAT
jgi:hypothetical protein